MILARTQNSAYEIDLENKRCRRLKGANAPTPYQGEDGVWKHFNTCRYIEGGGILFVWNEEGQYTYTSNVVTAFDDETPIGEFGEE